MGLRIRRGLGEIVWSMLRELWRSFIRLRRLSLIEQSKLNNLSNNPYLPQLVQSLHKKG